MTGEHLDISSEHPPPAGPARPGGRRFIGIHFACCDVYTRIYVNRTETAYEGRCPKCARAVLRKHRSRRDDVPILYRPLTPMPLK